MHLKSSILLICIIAAFILPCTSGQSCKGPPIYVDIHPRAVAGSNHFEYGAFMGLGHQIQRLSLWPSLGDEGLFVADVDFCSTSSSPECPTNTHGFFNPEGSTT